MPKKDSLIQSGERLAYDVISNARVTFRATEESANLPESDHISRKAADEPDIVIPLSFLDYVSEAVARLNFDNKLQSAFEPRLTKDIESGDTNFPLEQNPSAVRRYLKEGARAVIQAIDVFDKHAKKTGIEERATLKSLQVHMKNVRQSIMWSPIIKERFRQKDMYSKQEEGLSQPKYYVGFPTSCKILHEKRVFSTVPAVLRYAKAFSKAWLLIPSEIDRPTKKLANPGGWNQSYARAMYFYLLLHTIWQVRSSFVQKRYRQKVTCHLKYFRMAMDPDESASKFRDVRFVCLGSSSHQMKNLMTTCLRTLRFDVPAGLALTDLCPEDSQFTVLKAGPILVISHDGGSASMSILLHELFQWLHYARVTEKIKLLRVVPSGGIGLRPGSVVVSRNIFDGLFRNYHEETILGQTRHYEALLSEELIQQLLECQEKLQLPAPVMDGNTLSMGDFYEGHGRLDGAFCDYTHIERIRFLQKCLTHYGICNTDTSAMVFAALTHRAGVEAAIVSVITMDRFTESSVNPEKAKHMDEWYKRPHRLIAELIQKTIQSCGDTAPFRGCHISEKYCHENQLIPIKVLLLADLQRRLDRTIEKVSRRTKTPEVEVPEKYRQFRPLTKDVHSEFFSKQET